KAQSMILTDPERPLETPRHQKAFEIFVGLGDGRNYRQVAQQVGVSLGTIKRWAKAHNWQAKVQERDARTARQIADRALENPLEDINRKRKLIRAALIRLGQAIAQGKIRLQLADLDRLIRLDGTLSGYPDGRTSAAGMGASSLEQFIAYIDMTPIHIKEEFIEQAKKEPQQAAGENAEREPRHQEASETVARQQRRGTGRDTAGS
ncbi:MAG: hypothetical protein IMY82_07445, partial [Chloroflexi bacterium]|nr:hypothetical protein [Chloroflexota bacterium]